MRSKLRKRNIPSRAEVLRGRTRTPSRGSDRSARPNVTREEILIAAARLIVSRGYAACTMRAVAEQVQIKAGSLYYHFSSKDQIIKEILNSGLVMLLKKARQRLETLPRNATFAERIRAAIDVHISSMASRDAVLMQIYEHLPPVLKRESSAMRKDYASLWFELFSDGIERGEIASDLNLTLFVPYFLGGLNRVPEWSRSVGAEAPEVARLAATVLLDGVATRQAAKFVWGDQEEPTHKLG
jgi:TetR/AcrR family transcriptional regulator, cholesterol catabolism regulator